jgi:hypothetical protein
VVRVKRRCEITFKEKLGEKRYPKLKKKMEKKLEGFLN